MTKGGMVRKKQQAAKNFTAQPMDSPSTFVDSTQETERQKVEPIVEKIYQPRQGEKAKVREDSQATDSEESSLPPFTQGKRGQSACHHLILQQIPKEEININQPT